GDLVGNAHVVRDLYGRRVVSGRPLVVFDLDGTLIDSRRDLTASANALIVERGGAPLPETAINPMIGEGAALLVRRALTAAGLDTDLSRERQGARGGRARRDDRRSHEQADRAGPRAARGPGPRAARCDGAGRRRSASAEARPCVDAGAHGGARRGRGPNGPGR